jgi:hypothetical protein
MWRQARILTAYLVGVFVVLAILNGIDWWWDAPRALGLTVLSAGFLVAALGMCLPAYLYRDRRATC